MLDIDKVKRDLAEEIEILNFEISTLNRIFIETRFFGHASNFPNAHFGYLMVCMGKIDALSAHWQGNIKDQTKRMNAFMNKYLHPGKTEENRVAVQMFRHSLMHTGALRFLYSRTTNSKYTWRVYFGYLPNASHYTITTEDERFQDILKAKKVSSTGAPPLIKALNVEILQLAADLKLALTTYLADLETDVALQANYEKIDSLITIQEFN